MLQKLRRSPAIPPFRGNNLEHFAFVIDRAPQVMCLTVDADKHLSHNNLQVKIGAYSWGLGAIRPCTTVCGRSNKDFCYCEIQIRDNDDHIEHMEPRSQNQARTYDYTNFTLSCNGGAIEHCGHYKDDRAHNPDYAWDDTRFVPPHDPATAKQIQYLPDGNITPTEENPGKATYLIGYLGLNCARLNYRRREHARNLINTLGDQPEQYLITWLRQDHLQVDANGRLNQFYSLSKQILEP